MRALILTPLPLPDPERHRHGIWRRFRLLVGALGRVAEHITIVHFVAGDEVSPALAMQASEIGSRFWGVTVEVACVPLDTAPRAPWRLAAAPFRLDDRRDVRPFLDGRAIGAIGGIVARGHDLVLAHRLAMMEVLRRFPDLPPIAFDLDDVEHAVKEREAASAPTLAERWRRRIEVPALLAAERRAIRRAACTFVCSQEDRRLLGASRIDTARVMVVPNAVGVPPHPAPPCSAPNVLFLGHYGHAPNAAAAERLVTRIWPLVRAANPAAHLIVAGDRPDLLPSHASAPEGVEFTGLVADLAPLYARTRVVCCPMVHGGGTRMKLIEAASEAKAMVSTAMGAEGLAFRDGRDILIRESDEAIARATLDLLAGDDLARALGTAAHATCLMRYSREAVEAQVAGLLRGLPLGGAAGARRAHPPTGEATATAGTEHWSGGG